MALKPASLQREYSLCFSGDPALDLPSIPPLAPDAPEAERVAVENVVKERERLLRIARDNCTWKDILRPGVEPTVFTFRRIPGPARDWLEGQMERCTQRQIVAYAFRIAIKTITGFDGWKLTKTSVDGVEMADDDCMEKIYEVGGDAMPLLGRDIVTELGSEVFLRSASGVRPL